MPTTSAVDRSSGLLQAGGAEQKCTGAHRGCAPRLSDADSDPVHEGLGLRRCKATRAAGNDQRVDWFARAGKGPMTVVELAATAKVDERYLREWLSHQVASNYLSYDPNSGRFALPPEQAIVFANEESPAYMIGGFDLMASTLEPKVEAAFKSGGGIAWATGLAACSAPSPASSGQAITTSRLGAWLLALDGIIEKLEVGARVADIGCGHGWSTGLMAKAFSRSQFVGYDFHLGSIKDARAHAKAHGVSRNARFEVGLAKDYLATTTTS